MTIQVSVKSVSDKYFFVQLLTTAQRTHPDGLKVKSRVQVGLSPTRTLTTPVLGNFWVGGHMPTTPVISSTTLLPPLVTAPDPDPPDASHAFRG
jgi:hypothetical protein